MMLRWHRARRARFASRASASRMATSCVPTCPSTRTSRPSPSLPPPSDACCVQATRVTSILMVTSSWLDASRRLSTVAARRFRPSSWRTNCCMSLASRRACASRSTPIFTGRSSEWPASPRRGRRSRTSTRCVMVSRNLARASSQRFSCTWRLSPRALPESQSALVSQKCSAYPPTSTRWVPPRSPSAARATTSAPSCVTLASSRMNMRRGRAGSSPSPSLSL
mmetsp:Transcript_19059/g.38848  ORF Transcript_19059/g.38848 Transcript_19059/m.38848 type:complete len:223 (+) Transcript_19059:1061-1729(+)